MHSIKVQKGWKSKKYKVRVMHICKVLCTNKEKNKSYIKVYGELRGGLRNLLYLMQQREPTDAKKEITHVN